MRTPKEILDDAMHVVMMEIEMKRGSCYHVKCEHKDYRGHEEVCSRGKKTVDLWHELEELKKKFEKGELRSIGENE